MLVWIIFNTHSFRDVYGLQVHTGIQNENQFRSSESTVMFNLHNAQCVCVCVRLTDWLFGRVICHSAGKSIVKKPTVSEVWFSPAGDDRVRGMKSVL